MKIGLHVPEGGDVNKTRVYDMDDPTRSLPVRRVELVLEPNKDIVAKVELEINQIDIDGMIVVLNLENPR